MMEFLEDSPGAASILGGAIFMFSVTAVWLVLVWALGC